ncbi:hypothetical protein BDV95DRAFT_591446 [Massariosphaeria phaeospora]|uniref:Uncharacterized protein n=1 Tax=Massariosphaeria phaeospora TaxID=100035 RepID=A0A7C8MGK7_9PLEO|nr:hypothetical protein BDV95DRAFT_591446 [Massariosphaeria phaeospora]
MSSISETPTKTATDIQGDPDSHSDQAEQAQADLWDDEPPPELLTDADADDDDNEAEAESSSSPTTSPPHNTTTLTSPDTALPYTFPGQLDDVALAHAYAAIREAEFGPSLADMRAERESSGDTSDGEDDSASARYLKRARRDLEVRVGAKLDFESYLKREQDKQGKGGGAGGSMAA